MRKINILLVIMILLFILSTSIAGLILSNSIKNYNKPKQYKIELTYSDNTSELLIYDELPYVTATDSNSFSVIDSKHTIHNVKLFKIIVQ